MQQALQIFMGSIMMMTLSSSLIAGQKPSSAVPQEAQKAPTQAPQIINEPDQTDALAIPLDNSEEEENMEIKQLDQLQEKLEKKKEQQAQDANAARKQRIAELAAQG